MCYCVPDYHGILCELKYDDCESKFANCENGGTCVDGINNFTCSCPAQYSGETCTEYIGFSSSTVTNEFSGSFSKSEKPLETVTESIQIMSTSTSVETVFMSSPTASSFTTDYSESRELFLKSTKYPPAFRSTSTSTTIGSMDSSTATSSSSTKVGKLNITDGITNTTTDSFNFNTTVAYTNVSFRRFEFTSDSVY